MHPGNNDICCVHRDRLRRKIRRDEAQRKRTGLKNKRSEHHRDVRDTATTIAPGAIAKHRHLKSEKGGEYDSFKNRMKLHATKPLQREERQRLEATTTKRCSSAGECRNAIPNCGRHRQPTTEQHARTASWMRTDQATGSNRGT